jgi:hypothetical protein
MRGGANTAMTTSKFDFTIESREDHWPGGGGGGSNRVILSIDLW